MAKSKLLLYLAGFFFFISAFVFLPRVLADTTDFENAVRGDQANRQDFVNGIVNDLISKGNTAVGGCVTDGCENDPELASGALQSTSKAIAWTFNQPADTRMFIADMLQDFGIAQPAHAQGLGFSALTPILEIWKIFRNIAYVIFVLIMLVIGFAIMFRKNLGGQAEVTVQQALPKIVVALLMVTFSYAIAGLLIDIMYIAMFFLITVFGASGLIDTQLVNTAGGGVLSQNIFQVFWGLISQGFATKTGEVVSLTIESMFAGGGGIVEFIGGRIGGFIVGALATLVIFVALLIAMFKTLFGLIKVYVEIILSIVFAPLILALGAIQSNAFGNWVKSLAVNLATFPVLLVFILVGYMFIGTTSRSTTQNQIVGTAHAQFSSQLNEEGFVPPFIPGRGNTEAFVLIAMIGIVLVMSEVPTLVGRFKPKSIFDDLGGMAWKNAVAGEAGIPLVTGLGYGGYGAARAAYASATAKPGGIRANILQRPRSFLKDIRQGYERTDDEGNVVAKIGGLKPHLDTGFKVGSDIRGRIDDIQENRFLEPDNYRKLLQRIAEDKKPHEEKPKPTNDPPISN